MKHICSMILLEFARVAVTQAVRNIETENLRPACGLGGGKSLIQSLNFFFF